jgi:transcription antitermination factor NusG
MIESNLKSGGIETGNWYAVYTRHQHEKKVAESFAGNGIEVFLPLYETVRRWKDRDKHLLLPLFSCYVFLRVAIQRRADILSTPGVHSFVMTGNQLASISHLEIEALRRASESRLRIEPHPFVNVGDRVRITSGPLLGIEGIVIREKKVCRLILSAQLLEKSVAIEVDGYCIEPIHGHRKGESLLPAWGVSSGVAQQIRERELGSLGNMRLVE